MRKLIAALLATLATLQGGCAATTTDAEASCSYPSEAIAETCAEDALFVEENPAGVVTCYWACHELVFVLASNGCYELAEERRTCPPPRVLTHQPTRRPLNEAPAETGPFRETESPL